ncbi:hypothetical protein RHGRI_023073 [Rhododendron griersonianum]|uniref:Clp ATPase C-terminal domain-containing protein n=1 Tax=Rhododendron griersonianum TaxID=479676 RepID=A0AAV6J4I7_9ERIC|nr:hypothetical protein RHGRI_023073 [Rhododendron griersonianum]
MKFLMRSLNSNPQAEVLSDRYISGRFLPDKAIDLVDEAAAKLKMEITSKPTALDEIYRLILKLEMERLSLMNETDKASNDRFNRIEAELALLKEKQAQLTKQWECEKTVMTRIQSIKEEIDRVNLEIQQAEREYDLNRAAELKYGSLTSLQRQLEAAQKELEEHARSGKSLLREEDTADDIAEIVSKWTGIPVSKLKQSEREKLLHLEEELHKRVVGQEPAVKSIAEAIQWTADRESLKGPYSVFLFDEIEKAHSDVFNVLLQILDDGRVTDSHGRTVSFTNTIIIMTLNVGSQYILNMYDQKLPKEQAYETIKQRVLEAARSVFRPEFINRVDELYRFQAPGPRGDKPNCQVTEFVATHCFLLFHLEFACVLQLERVLERLADRKIKIQVTDAAVQFLGELGYDPNYGARPVKRVIQQYIENELAKGILRGEFKEEDTVLIDTEVTASSDGQLPQQKLVLKRLEPDSDTSAAENREALSQTQ